MDYVESKCKEILTSIEPYLCSNARDQIGDKLLGHLDFFNDMAEGTRCDGYPDSLAHEYRFYELADFYAKELTDMLANDCDDYCYGVDDAIYYMEQARDEVYYNS